jgi:hypothetical protein
MIAVNPALENRFATVVRFLMTYPESAAKLRGKYAPAVGTEDYVLAAARSFAQAREPKRPERPATIPDEMVSFVLQHYFNIPATSLERIKNEHALAMGAENIVGDLLERYLAENMEPLGWVWCTGSVVKAVDFINPPAKGKDNWILLQVKNRDNSENSSSSAIRTGTTIQKWFRTYSKKSGTNWAAFPDATVCPQVSEAGFKAFALNYLRKLKT